MTNRESRDFDSTQRPHILDNTADTVVENAGFQAAEELSGYSLTPMRRGARLHDLYNELRNLSAVWDVLAAVRDGVDPVTSPARIALLLAAVVGIAACNAMTGAGSARPIAEASFLRIGGIEQWVTVRGADVRNAVVLLIHGGPGDVQSGFASTYADYERQFVLVQWDQRGAGLTFARNGAASELTFDRSVQDGIELAESLRRRFPASPLILLGHSWGSVIATRIAQRRPELFAAYVGTGQVASWAAGVRYQFDFLAAQAKLSGDVQTTATLEAIGRPDPLNLIQYSTFSRALRQYMNAADQNWLTGLKERALAEGATEADIQTIADGMRYSGRQLSAVQSRLDLPTTANSFALPYCVIQGRDDRSTPTDPARAYFDGVTAPRKRFLVIETAGHFALVTHRAEFIAALRECLRG
jgi:pimeloyl-ACP methyl ester carboxylesterase